MVRAKCTKLIVLVFAALTLLPTQFAWAEITLSDDTYRDLRDLCLKIMSKAPPSHYFYVGIGRSPTGVIRFFQELNPGIAINLPSSGRQESRQDDAIAREERWKLFDDFLSIHQSQFDTRSILLIDFVISGGSLDHGYEALKEYFKVKGPRVKISTMALGVDSPDEKVISGRGVVTQPFQKYDFVVGADLRRLGFDFKEFSEYLSFTPNHRDSLDNHAKLSLNRANEFVPQIEYGELGTAIRKHMLEDTSLSAQLSEGLKVPGPKGWETVSDFVAAILSNPLPYRENLEVKERLGAIAGDPSVIAPVKQGAMRALDALNESKEPNQSVATFPRTLCGKIFAALAALASWRPRR